MKKNVKKQENEKNYMNKTDKNNNEKEHKDDKVSNNESKKKITVYFIFRVLVILCMVAQILLGNVGNALICILALILFTLPSIIKKRFKIGIPGTLEAIIYCFIFATTILGEINNFYVAIPFWDTMLHTLNGFVCAGIGFSLVNLLNENSEKFNVSPLYIAIVAFCFSMTVGVLWEFFEYGVDKFIEKDMQKDKIVTEISSVKLNEEGKNEPVILKDIEKTEIYLKDGSVVNVDGGYLDIGLNDTMKDLFVNFIGAFLFSVIGILYLKYEEKFKFVEEFIPSKVE